MEFDTREEDEFLEHEEIEIYSKRAIWGFSLFFSPIFGAVLLMMNLRAAGHKNAGYTVLFFSIAYTIFGSLLFNYLGMRTGGFGVIWNIIGAAILAEYFFKKYFPENDYYPRSIAKPLMISLLITLVVVIALFYNGNPLIK
jgi:hypothetical protein